MSNGPRTISSATMRIIGDEAAEKKLELEAEIGREIRAQVYRAVETACLDLCQRGLIVPSDVARELATGAADSVAFEHCLELRSRITKLVIQCLNYSMLQRRKEGP